jgi:signal transduction histidine kinase
MHTRILHACLSRNPTTDFPLDVFCEELGAVAATFWVQGDFDTNEMTLSGWHNRPDLERDHDRVSFSLDRSFAGRWRKSSPQYVLRCTRDEFQRLRWDNNQLKAYAVETFQGIVFICLRTGTQIVGLVHLYYDRNPPRLNGEEMSMLATLLGAYIKTFSDEMRSIMIERRKIGHEIARMISQADSKLSSIAKRIEKLDGLQQPISDLKKALSAAYEAASNKTFVEGVYDRMPRASFILLRPQILTALHLAIAKFNKPFSMVTQNNVSGTIEIKMSQDDIGLLLSNILMNAVKYTVLGGSISIKFTSPGRGGTLIVSNMSARMSRSDLERVWRFGIRGPNAGGIEGDGIGLSIVSDICSAYNIGVRLTQRRTEHATWTDLALSFPPRLCRQERHHWGH